MFPSTEAKLEWKKTRAAAYKMALKKDTIALVLFNSQPDTDDETEDHQETIRFLSSIRGSSGADATVPDALKRAAAHSQHVYSSLTASLRDPAAGEHAAASGTRRLAMAASSLGVDLDSSGDFAFPDDETTETTKELSVVDLSWTDESDVEVTLTPTKGAQVILAATDGIGSIVPQKKLTASTQPAGKKNSSKGVPSSSPTKTPRGLKRHGDDLPSTSKSAAKRPVPNLVDTSGDKTQRKASSTPRPKTASEMLPIVTAAATRYAMNVHINDFTSSQALETYGALREAIAECESALKREKAKKKN